jgi:hypothetical protein
VAILPPTVHERLARCGTRVLVTGLITGADVTVTVGGTSDSFVATGPARSVAVPSLPGGDSVQAEQDDGSGPSGLSPPVVVEQVSLPPEAVPQLPSQVGGCSQCVHVGGLVPGCAVQLLQAEVVVGDSVANRHGNACIKVDLEMRDEVGQLNARMIVCGEDGPLATTPIVLDTVLPQPVVGSPLYGCQRVVPLSNTHPGAAYRLETDTGTDLGSFCNCWHAVNVTVAHELVVGEFVRAQPSWASNRCEEDGPWSDFREVVEPDEGITPVLLPALIENDQLIRVDNQIAGAQLTVLIRDGEGLPETPFGPRPANPNPIDLEIALAEPLRVDQQVKVAQELCGHREESDWVTVLPEPPVVHPPVVLPPLYACAGRVHLYNLHPGATVRVFQNGFVVGVRWAGASSSLSIPTAPGLVVGGEVHAVQSVGSTESLPSSPPVIVTSLEEMQRPRILTPVALGDNRVWVSGVSPGSRVSIRSGSTLLGEAHASEPIVSVAVSAVQDSVRAAATICEVTSSSAQVQAIDDPMGPGPFPASGSQPASYPPDFPVPSHGGDGGFPHPIAGRLYYPAHPGGEQHQSAFGVPLVVIAHGYWPPDEDSYLGYDYLAHHLARWGMYVFSVNMDDVNDKTSTERLQQSSRGEIILEAARRVIADPDLAGRIDRDRIGLVGHSMSGEGVVAAQDVNLGSTDPLGIRGVVSIAPTHWRPDLSLRDAKYLQLYGSRDQLLSSLLAVTGTDPQFGGFRIFDRAERPKTHAWIYEARHNGFNTEWFNGLDVAESGRVDETLGLGAHQTIASALINSFFQDALVGATEYAGYMEGPVLPRAVQAFDVYTQHLSPSAVVIDDFGDADSQLGLPEETLDKSTNRVSEPVAAAGGGLGAWDDLEFVGLAHSVHDTKGVELSWSDIDVLYQSDTGGLALASTSWISVRVAQFYEDAAANFPGQDLDVFIGLSDGAMAAVVRLGLVAPAPYPDTFRDPLSVLRTGRLPLDAFTAVNLDLNLSSIEQVRVLTMAKATGHLLLDDIEFLP